MAWRSFTDRLPQELVPLVATVNGLLFKVERAIERERRFTGDAAHALRTPLTAVKTHLQVPRISTDRHGISTALDRAEQGVRRLQNTIDQLLMLGHSMPAPLPSKPLHSCRQLKSGKSGFGMTPALPFRAFLPSSP